MVKQLSAESLLVQLVIDDGYGLTEKQFWQRCREVRDAFRMLFEVKENRPLTSAGPLSAHEPSILVRDENDILCIEAWTGAAVDRVVLSKMRLSIDVPFDQEIEYKPKKHRFKHSTAQRDVSDDDATDSSPMLEGSLLLMDTDNDE